MNSKNRRRVSRKRVSRKRVSRKRVSRKRVSRKRVSRKRVSRKRVSRKRRALSRTSSKRRQAIRKFKYRLFAQADGEDVPHNVLGMFEDRDIEGYIDEDLNREEYLLNVDGLGFDGGDNLCINPYPIQGCREHFIKLYHISDNYDDGLGREDNINLYVFIAEPDAENAQAMLSRRLALIREGRDPAELRRTAGPLPRPIIWYFRGNRGNNVEYTGNNEICLEVIGSNRELSFFNPERDESGGGWPETAWLLDTESVYRELLAPDLMAEPEIKDIVFEEREEEAPLEEEEEEEEEEDY